MANAEVVVVSMPPPPASSQGVPLPMPAHMPRPPLPGGAQQQPAGPDMSSPVALCSANPVLLPTLLPPGPPTPPFAPRVSQQSRPSPGRQTLFATPSQRNSMAVLQRDFSRRPSLLAQSPSQLRSPPSLQHQRRMSLSADADTLLRLMGPSQPFETSSLQRATSADGEQNGGRGNDSSKGDGVSAIDLVRHRAAMVQLSALQAPRSGRDGAKVAAASAAGSALRAAVAAGSAAACALESAAAAWRARAAGAAAGAARVARQAAANAVARAQRATTCAHAAATNATHAARAAAQAAALAARVAVAASASCRLVAERAVLVARHSAELRTAALSIQCSVRGRQAKAAASVRRGVRGTDGAAAAAAAAASAAWAAAIAAADANATAARAISSADAAWRTHEEAYAYFDPGGYC